MNPLDDFAAVQVKLAALGEIFRPSAPTDNLSLFRGRMREIENVMSGVQQIGQHVIVYGERGVGKTSLSYIARGLFLGSVSGVGISVRIECSEGNTFEDVWAHFFRELRMEIEKRSKDDRLLFAGLVEQVEILLVLFEGSTLLPDAVVAAMELIAARSPLLIIIDEFDRLGAWEATVPFSDVIKSLSDRVVRMTLLIVGVADNIDGLIRGHQSLGRSLRQVAMPRMSQQELAEIVTGGFVAYTDSTGDPLLCERPAARGIARIAQGFPYYAHLLAGAAGAWAIRRSEKSVSLSTVLDAMLLAVEDATHAIRSAYTEAVSGRADAQLAPTLLACAMAKTDDLGFFSSTDAARELTKILGQQRGPAHVNNHLRRFAAEPIWILDERRRGERSIRYRFHDPLMRPFVMIRGYSLGLLPKDGMQADDDSESPMT